MMAHPPCGGARQGIDLQSISILGGPAGITPRTPTALSGAETAGADSRAGGGSGAALRLHVLLLTDAHTGVA